MLFFSHIQGLKREISGKVNQVLLSLEYKYFDCWNPPTLAEFASFFWPNYDCTVIDLWYSTNTMISNFKIIKY